MAIVLAAGETVIARDRGRQMKPNRNMMALGLAIGVGVGTALGVALDNIAIGVAVGAGAGVALGAALNGKRQP